MSKGSLAKLFCAITKFRASQLGNVALVFALAAEGDGAVARGDVASALKDKKAMQNALDAASLALAKSGSTLTTSQVQPAAQTWFEDKGEIGVNNIVITASYDATTQTAVVCGSGSYATSLLKIAGFDSIPVAGTATAKMTPKTWPICVMVTAPASNHTLLTKDTAAINFYNCMVQVNTQNWDAVEAQNTSYIHSTSGDNCFVGDIHFGDITPAKDVTCNLFTDPFAGYAMPASASTCTC